MQTGVFSGACIRALTLVERDYAADTHACVLVSVVWLDCLIARSCFDQTEHLAHAPCVACHAHLSPMTAGQTHQLPIVRHRSVSTAALGPPQRCSQLQQARFCMLHASGISSRSAGHRPLSTPTHSAAPRWSRSRDRCPQPGVMQHNKFGATPPICVNASTVSCILFTCMESWV
jgi:hypothetical protein